jgi:hypothetical protein
MVNFVSNKIMQFRMEKDDEWMSMRFTDLEITTATFEHGVAVRGQPIMVMIVTGPLTTRRKSVKT